VIRSIQRYRMDRINSPDRARSRLLDGANTLCSASWYSDTVSQYQNARLHHLSAVNAVDESALENVTARLDLRPRSADGRHRRPRFVRLGAGHIVVWPLPKPHGVSRKPDLPLTMVATSSCGPDDRRATWRCGRGKPRSASRTLLRADGTREDFGRMEW